MHPLLDRFKPGGSRRSHLLLAALLWTAIGALLLTRGISWLAGEDVLIFIFPALLAGILKSRFILDKAAKKSIDRIADLRDGTCLGAVYSKKTWGLVLLMMATGVLLKMSQCPRSLLGVLYVTVGAALIMSSRLGWRSWRR